MKEILAILLILALATLACSLDFSPPPIALTPQQSQATRTPFLVQPTLTSTSLPPSTTPLPAPSATIPPPTTTAVSPGLNVDQVLNSTLTFTSSDQTVRTITLKNGKFSNGTDPAQPGYVDITTGNQVALGDLNADGLDDAAIILAENYGGSGVFVSLVAILNQGGQPQAVASVFIDDRPIINTLSITNGEIFLDATVHGINDPGCCPALGSTRRYRLVENNLAISHYTTRFPGGTERVITIGSPSNNSQLTGPFIVKGSVTVSPFENNLVYSVFQPGASEPFSKAGFIIQAEMGGPGTFELPLDLSTGAVKGPIRIQISDLSPADGSLIAADTIYLVLK